VPATGICNRQLDNNPASGGTDKDDNHLVNFTSLICSLPF
jgi:hypothetical protein